MVTRCLLIRHGEITANVEQLWYGTTDGELTRNGEQQIAQLGNNFSNENINISSIYSSPLKRTMKTAEALGAGQSLPVTPHQSLIEFGVGEWEGLSYEVIAGEHRFFDKLSEDPNFAPVGGESVIQVFDRMVEVFFTLVERHRGENIALVGHGAAFAILMAGLLENNPYPFFEHHMSNTGISLLEVSADNEVQRLWFDRTAHLE